MNIKQVISLLIVSIFFISCSKDPTPPKDKNLENLKNVELNVDAKGNVVANKTFIQDNDKKETIVQEKLSSNKPNNMSKGYEVVPDFGKKISQNKFSNKKLLKKEVIKIRGKDVKISVEAIPLNEFIDLVFSNVLKLNYTVSKEVKSIKNPITLNMSNLQPRQEVLNVVLKLLSSNGVTVKRENGILFLSKAPSSKNKTDSNVVYIGYGTSIDKSIPDDDEIMMFIPLHYVTASTLRHLLRAAGVKSPTEAYNLSKHLQMQKNSAGEIRKTLNIIRLLDRPFMENKKTVMIDFQHIEVNDFIKNIKNILAANGVKIVKNPTEEGLLLTPIKELNSLYVISPEKSWIDMLMYWKDKLDIKSEVPQEPRFYTYAVRQRKADDLAKALNSVLAMKLSTVKIVDVKNKTIDIKNKKVKSKQINNAKNKNSSGYSVVADLPTNTLMIKMTPSQYREVLPIIEKLDALPLQVLAEVTLAEVTMTDAFDLGFEHTFKNDAAQGGANIVSTAVTAAFGGAGFSATFAGNNLSSVINAYAEKKLLNILSKPKILILNNNTGTINVGKQVPVITSNKSSDSADNSIIQTVQYRSTGVTVGLTPTINSNGIVTMKVSINLSEAQLNSTSSIDSPLIVTRALNTVLTIKSGNTVLLGGLISTNDSLTNSGVPVLKDIPGLGELFKTTSNTKAKTELIMLIRPYIVHIPEEMSQKTRNYKKILNLLNKYILF